MNGVDAGLGSLHKLPLEIRQKVYAEVCADQIVHCCSMRLCPVKQHLLDGSTLEQQIRDFYGNVSCQCIALDVEPLLRQVKWQHVNCPSISGGTASDVLPVLLVSKAVQVEAEIVILEKVTFVIGLSQFAAFYRRFFGPQRRAGKAHSRELRNLHLAIHDPSPLSGAIGFSYRHNRLDNRTYVAQETMRSVNTLLNHSADLRNLSITLDYYRPSHRAQLQMLDIIMPLASFLPCFPKFQLNFPAMLRPGRAYALFGDDVHVLLKECSLMSDEVNEIVAFGLALRDIVRGCDHLDEDVDVGMHEPLIDRQSFELDIKATPESEQKAKKWFELFSMHHCRLNTIARE